MQVDEDGVILTEIWCVEKSHGLIRVDSNCCKIVWCVQAIHILATACRPPRSEKGKPPLQWWSCIPSPYANSVLGQCKYVGHSANQSDEHTSRLVSAHNALSLMGAHGSSNSNVVFIKRQMTTSVRLQPKRLRLVFAFSVFYWNDEQLLRGGVNS